MRHRAYPTGNVKDKPYTFGPRQWGFQAQLLPYLEAKEVFEMVRPGYTTYAYLDCFQYAAMQPPDRDPEIAYSMSISVPTIRMPAKSGTPFRESAATAARITWA